MCANATNEEENGICQGTFTSKGTKFTCIQMNKYVNAYKSSLHLKVSGYGVKWLQLGETYTYICM